MVLGQFSHKFMPVPCCRRDSVSIYLHATGLKSHIANYDSTFQTESNLL